MIDSTIFKAYDVRDVYPDKIDKEVANAIGRAFAEMRKRELGREKVTIGVGRDMRVSSPELNAALIEGITAQGVDVVDLGLVSTPTFYFAISSYGFDGGVQVSASHNPAKFNGFKLTRERALPVGAGTGMEALRDAVIKGDFPASTRKGTVTPHTNPVVDEVNFSLAYAGASKIKPFKVVVDSASGMGALSVEELFKHLPCTLVRMNFELDGTFPAHEADPLKDENMVDLKKCVVAEGADMGIATDGDGDRIFFVDNTGRTISPAIMRGWFAQIFLRDNPGALVGYDVRPGRITEDLIKSAGGKPLLMRVGHSLAKTEMIKTGALYSGESSGHFFLTTKYGAFETPVIMILKVLQDMSAHEGTLEELVRPWRKYHESGEINFKVADRVAVLARLTERYHGGKRITLDGLSVEYPTWWFNVRVSNTEPLVRLNLESGSAELTQEKVKELSALIQQ
ncbi:MAG TPA: phosphomannomutase/phosphoglucomutase [Candidatus Magasanikbacteria bacterium]|nr:phosphomannomutase/phosphoglucomutase [Candidatus Magasanikbacteria bacterium]